MVLAVAVLAQRLPAGTLKPVFYSSGGSMLRKSLILLVVG
jgi:adenosylmethionine-8-amino-7-oxononanoate aminotransferase